MAHSSVSRERYNQIFKKAISTLNPEQHNAVSQTEGPVMVLAGPGTGKTQILAVRIGNILASTPDIAAHNILCLTFTDAATVAMRKRLVEIIGPDAHKIHIYTYHSFCNQVIQENLGYFGGYRQLDQLSDLERVDVYNEIIEKLPNDHRLKSLKSDPSFEAKRLDNLFSMMKKENYTVQEILDKVDEYLAEMRDHEDYTYKRKTTRGDTTYMKGDFNPNKYAELVAKFESLKAGAPLFEEYKAILDRIGRYDYHDMILWVLEAFKEDDMLLAQYQERYQYFLVDEYQDTNGAQNGILEQLISWWDTEPNVFVVGDDDQAIYKFQGANVQNIKEFQKKYSPETIALKNNYRSGQPILDTAQALIQYNQERMKNAVEGTEVLLEASGENKNYANPPKIVSYDNVVHEQAALVNYLKECHDKDQDLSKMAIIYRNHKQVAKMVLVLEKMNIPLNIKKKIDVLKEPLIDNILNILYYIQSEYDKPNSAEFRLFELMHYNFFHIDSSDCAKIALHCRSRDGDNDQYKKWRDIISSRETLEKIGVRTAQEVFQLDGLLGKWTSDIANKTLQMLFEAILNEGYILKSIMQSADKTWLLQVVSTLFDYIKEETNKDPSLKLSDFLARIDKMKANDLPLEINKIVHSDKGINFITAHSAKGLEFEKVFMIGCTKNIWDKSGRNMYQYSYPKNVNEDVITDDNDERRLFYVAMTRAETDLQISFALQSENGKALGQSKFVDQIIGETKLKIEHQKISVDEVNTFQYYTLVQNEKEIKLIDNDLINLILRKYKLSVTGLNKYLKCPMTFYFETILRVPSGRNKYAGFGRAIHHALQYYYEDVINEKPRSVESFIQYFKKGMHDHRSHFTDTEYTNMTSYGEQILEGYHDQQLSVDEISTKYVTEYKVDNTEYNGVPIKGVLDRVDILKDSVHVVDYKTGNYEKYETKKKFKKPDDKTLLGGDYWRQMVFYKMLLDSHQEKNWKMTGGEIDFVEPKKNTSEYKRVKIVVTPEDLKTVGEQITETWKNIHDHKFGQLCDDEKCYWCDFVRNDYVFNIGNEEGNEDDIQDF